jgi:hypothetical protein
MISQNYDITGITYKHKLCYPRPFTVCMYSIVFCRFDTGEDYDIIKSGLWYHSYMVSYVYHIKFLRCYIIGKDYYITDSHQYQNLMWSHVYNKTCHIACQMWISVPLGLHWRLFWSYPSTLSRTWIACLPWAPTRTALSILVPRVSDDQAAVEAAVLSDLIKLAN